MNESEIRGAVQATWASGVRSFVISGVFSPLNAAQEEAAKVLVEDEVTQLAAGGPHICRGSRHLSGGLQQELWCFERPSYCLRDFPDPFSACSCFDERCMPCHKFHAHP